jgi:hypothetical protein
MKYLFITTAFIAACVFVAFTWGRVTMAPPELPPSSAVVQSAAPSPSGPASSNAALAPEAPSRSAAADMPDRSPAARQGSTEPVQSTSIRRPRAHHEDSKQGTQVNKAIANGFTAELNRQELQSLRSGVIAPEAPWRGLYPPR